MLIVTIDTRSFILSHILIHSQKVVKLSLRSQSEVFVCFVEKFEGDERGQLLMLARPPISLLALEEKVAVAASLEHC